MTTEEKAKAYDEALERAKQVRKYSSDLAEIKRMEDIFPELKESEDETIRKELADFIYITTFPVKDLKKKERFLTWLEKQGEQKHINDTDEDIVKAVKDTSILDMVEPKFHEGDWVVDSQGLTHQIERVVENVTTHTFGYDIVGGGYFNNDNESVHLWTIQDAKDGDVLAGSKGEAILMFRGIGNTEWDDVIDYYCYYDCRREDFIVQENVEYWGNIEDNQLKPATKEQRDTLFAKMKEFGYGWDFEKKELMKIEKNTDVNHEYFSELLENDDSKDINDYAYQVAYCMSHDWLEETATWEDVQKAVKLGAEWNERHHNSSWSEEDAVNFNLVYTYVSDDSLRDWLKELKDRVQPQTTWKPNDEQMIALSEASGIVGMLTPRGMHLQSLYNDLKKLKGE